MSFHKVDIIPSHRINKEKWDACIHRSESPLIYAHSYYLDTLTDNWNGIVVNDYDCVMPFSWRKKLGIRYCYDVPFVQQLGYFNTTNIDHSVLINEFSRAIKYGHYSFNYNNASVAKLPGVITSTNFIVDLTNEETIRNNFTKSFMQSLRNTQEYDLTYIPASIDEAILEYKHIYGNQLKNISNSDYNNFQQLAKALSDQNKCISRKIINKNGDLLAVSLLLRDKKRLYNIINAITAEGRKTEANYLLYEKLCNEFAGQGLLFDLEGSELPGVKSFYKKLGAIDQPYYRMKINNLPFPLKLLTA